MGFPFNRYEEKSAEDLLEDVQDLVKNGGDEEGIETIQKLVDDELLPGRVRGLPSGLSSHFCYKVVKSEAHKFVK